MSAFANTVGDVNKPSGRPPPKRWPPPEGLIYAFSRVDLAATIAVERTLAGEELGVISRILGHSDLGTTLRVYAHLDPRRVKAAAGRIDAALHRSLVDADTG